MIRCFLIAAAWAGWLHAAGPLEDWEARARMAHQIARERNDKALVAEAEALGRSLKQASSDSALRDLETRVGIDPGGWSMAGQPLFHPTGSMLEKGEALKPKLAAAMQSNDVARVRDVTAQMLAVLGDQAGVPDGRRPGRRAAIHSVSEEQVARWFVVAMKGEAPRLRMIARGEPLPDQMLRIYGGVMDGFVQIRPALQRHAPEAVADAEKVVAGGAAFLMKVQQSDGFFPFPDLRGKNLRFGDMISRAVSDQGAQVKDGWVITPDPDGGSQFDTGVCGVALLRAGELLGNTSWTQAGLKAADWAMRQPCVANFNYNAFSVSLLAQAFRVTKDPKYRDAALLKWRLGVAPGQAPNGRWMDAHNARTVYHVIILRAIGDLASVVEGSDRAELDAAARPAVTALLHEFDAMGITVDALPELLHLRDLYPDDAKLRAAAEATAAVIISKSTKGDQAKFGVPPDQFAALARVWP